MSSANVATAADDSTKPAFRVAAARRDPRILGLYVLFFVSGFPALLYQVVWQRALFTIYGVNIESVTMVVSAFMLGLGLGSLGGGWLSERRGVPLLAVFGIAELGIGLFGVFSLGIFRFVAQYTAGTSALGTGAITFILLLLPTALMGSTLPILTEHLVRSSGNVGRSVGSLYFVNTLGSAAACFCAVVFLMYRLGESGSVLLAAAINATVGLTVLILHFTLPKNYAAAVPAGQLSVPGGRRATPALAFHLAVWLAGLAGLVSLAYEILWYRAFSEACQGRAPAFALLLGFYLTGIAFGGRVSAKLCRKMDGAGLRQHLRNLGLFVIVANLLGYMVVPALGYLSRYHPVLALPLVSLVTTLLGAAFPLISHAAVIPDARAGRGLSRLYVSNIIGCTLGSLIVGYVLMDIWGMCQIAVAISLTGIALGTAILLGSATAGRSRMIYLACCAALGGLVIVSATPLFDRIYERLDVGRPLPDSFAYRDVVETRSGVAEVTRDLKVFGGGVYDGRINTDLVHDTNGLYRPFSISLWHNAPREVLMIGLSTGAWAQVIANHPQVEKLTVVEINPGYLKLIKKYPAVRSLLSNPKVSIVIDDGRRWLVRNRQAKFDVIVSNTTFHWRAHISALLSREFLELVSGHLRPAGVFLYNLTSSPEAQLTGITVFPHAVMVGNNMALSNQPFQLDLDRWQRVMEHYRIDGAPVFDLTNPEHVRRLHEVAAMLPASEQTQAIRAGNTATRMITDDNMGVEWRKVE
jgi:predicted membrane-bound spermidine synthase